MRIEEDIKFDFDDVLIRPKRSTLTSRNQVDLTRSFVFRNSRDTFTGIPIMAANMAGVGTFEVAKAINPLFTCVHKHYTVDQLAEWFDDPINCETTAYSMGIKDSDIEKFNAVMARVVNMKYVCIDVANGYTERFANVVSEIREDNAGMTIIAGNVVTGEMTEELILRGADVVKIGIGPGSVCTTRLVTGVGYPQLSAIIECADAAHGLGGHIIADGGCRTSGDIAKAFGAGADFVMLGGMLAAHEEALGDKEEGSFFGMSSDIAMKTFSGKKDSYRASEGRHVTLKNRGPIAKTVEEILGGLRSSCTYVGASKLKELSKRTTFVRVNNTHNRVYENN